MPPHGLCSVNSHRCCSPGFAEVRAVEQEPNHKTLALTVPVAKVPVLLKLVPKVNVRLVVPLVSTRRK